MRSGPNNKFLKNFVGENFVHDEKIRGVEIRLQYSGTFNISDVIDNNVLYAVISAFRVTQHTCNVPPLLRT